MRAFSNRPVPMQVIKEILELAARAPSGSNLQPWRVYVLRDQARDELIRRVHLKMQELPRGETPEYPIHPPNLPEPYSSHYLQASMLMYTAAGIGRDDMVARQQHFARNWSFYGAPVGLIFTIDRRLGPGQWMDVGMYLQNVMLLARDYDLHTCAQQAWALWPTLVSECLHLPQYEMVVCGMALGHADAEAPINGFTSLRAPFREYVTVVEATTPA
jgi:nitroreductase